MYILLLLSAACFVALDVYLGRRYSKTDGLFRLGKDDDEKVELPWQTRISIALALLSVFCAFLYLCARLIQVSLQKLIDGDAFISGALIVASFFLLTLWVHGVLYCVGGAFRQISERLWPGRSLWPKALDYLYYSSGGVFLYFTVTKITAAPISEVTWSVIFGIFVLNLKIAKTSIEIFPDIFASNVAIRNFERKTVVYRIWN